MMKNTTIIPLRISSCRVDCRKRLRPSAFMSAAQEAADINATSIGCGYSSLLEQNLTWVLSRMKVEYVTPPVFRQETVLHTWQKGMKGPFSIRDFEVRDAATSEVLVRSTSSWLLIDLGTRRLVRMDRIIGDVLNETAVGKDAIPEPCGRIKAPELTEKQYTRQVRFSDIDYNMHVNNARYMEWALDAVGSDPFSSGDLASYEITFNHEAHLSDCVDLRTAALTPSGRYVEGRRAEEVIFQCVMNFR